MHPQSCSSSLYMNYSSLDCRIGRLDLDEGLNTELEVNVDEVPAEKFPSNWNVRSCSFVLHRRHHSESRACVEHDYPTGLLPPWHWRLSWSDRRSDGTWRNEMESDTWPPLMDRHWKHASQTAARDRLLQPSRKYYHCWDRRRGHKQALCDRKRRHSHP